MRLKLSNWIPAVFCASLSLICLFAMVSGQESGPGLIPFLCFLPMCFFFVANVTGSLQQEVRELRMVAEVNASLRQEVRELRGQVTKLQTAQSHSGDAV